MAEENQHIILAAASDNNDEKKIIRRQVERQRRTQMSTLCASLRSSLPFQLIKGKRSMSDHIGEAANYVQFLKQKIDVLQMKRDRLKQMMVVNSSLLETSGNDIIPDHSSGARVKCVNMYQVSGGLKIEICCGLDEECSSVHLSGLIEILVQEGCDVVSCVSARVHGTAFHTLHSQVEDLTRLDLARLQHKLNHAILFHGNNYSN